MGPSDWEKAGDRGIRESSKKTGVQDKERAGVEKESSAVCCLGPATKMDGISDVNAERGGSVDSGLGEGGK